MKDIHVLYGFSSESIAEGISLSLKALGYRIFSVMRPTKQILREYLEEHREVNAVILKEYLDGGDSYSIKEIVDLVDNVSSLCKFIVVMSPSYRGKDSIRELYNAGILEVIFSDGKRGIEPDKIAELAVYGRTRKEAREYYKIDRRLIRKQHLTYSEYKEAVDYLNDESEGINLMDRFEHVTRWFTADQLASFITSMPAGLLDSVKQYREYYDYHNQLYRKGLLQNHLRCPRDAVRGLDANSYRKEATKPSVPMNEAPYIAPVLGGGSSGELGMPMAAGSYGDDEELELVEVGSVTHGSMGSDLGNFMEQQRRAADYAAYSQSMQQPVQAPTMSQAYGASQQPAYSAVAPQPVMEQPAYVTGGVESLDSMDVDSLLGMLG